MIKMFCDGCEAEIRRNYVNVIERYRPAKYLKKRPDLILGTNVSAEVIVTIGNTANAGHLCKDCLLQVLTSPDCEKDR